MSVSKENMRTNMTFNIELKTKLEVIAKQESRSFNNLVSKILSDYLEVKAKN